MEYYSAINPLLLSQPSCVEAIKNLNQQKTQITILNL